jgi:CIC family chloride channel protein
MKGGIWQRGLKRLWSDWMERLRIHLARPDALIQLAMLGLLTGLLAGGVIVIFRVVVERSQSAFLPGGSAENYEGLPLEVRFLLPLLGALVIALVFHRFAKGSRVLGVTKVMESMAYHQGYLSFRGFLLQFFGAAIAIISGHSVGREGPHIFLGAASGSLLGQALTLPNNSIRTMVGCGTAAGIAASFNTPLAGVIFALEVVMQEYTIASFMPVILSAVTATAVSFAVFGWEPAFQLPEVHLGSLRELPLVFLLGILAGALSALFIHLMQWTARVGKVVGYSGRVVLAGFILGCCAMLLPQVMGIGYDSVNAALLGELGIYLLMAILLMKLMATVASVGLGIPGGVIGPVLFMGAMLGSLLGQGINGLNGSDTVDVGLYALLGMGALMGASLQAPLAALTAMMELTQSPRIIMPGMLAIVVAGLTASEIFRKESLFITMLKVSGMDYNTNPVMLALRRVGVAGVMQKSFARPARLITREGARVLLGGEPEWLLVQGTEGPLALMPAVDLARHLQAGGAENGDEAEIDLLKIPARRFDVAPVYLQATLQEALDLLERGPAEALFVERMTAPGIKRVYGVLTREDVESAYRY